VEGNSELEEKINHHPIEKATQLLPLGGFFILARLSFPFENFGGLKHLVVRLPSEFRWILVENKQHPPFIAP